MQKIVLIHGPNFNLLGTREPTHYGAEALPSLNQRLAELAQDQAICLSTFQSNIEGELVNYIQQAGLAQADFIIINPAAYTHTSIAIRDALLAVAIPFIEVHISNIFARERFRHHSYLSDIAVGTITGLGVYGYELALNAAIQQLKQKEMV